ncbi:salicylate hydroxylase [Cladophialophora psammophila CBS 110553]|uniref:Salicylate hydroxylase n=1 Tax=Cladophialophora psammophila CBS 110553 TaxID=1182543 RepID=W9VHD8_9EURO|nr:salicylate hydroxylase [Cladophialophora psammophila CBS 110553]EXJ54893.1 salicylate hydroxylase [Cladophialophora psammophila CBS 110553]
MVGHRASLVNALYQGCKRQPAIRFGFSTKAQGLASFSPKPSFTAITRSGTPYQVTADILLAADGVKSTIRQSLLAALGIQDNVQDTGQAAYRIMLTREQMQHDSELLSLINTERSIYNLSTTQPDVNFAAAASTTYTTKGSKTSMLQVFGDFCPLIRRMLDLVPDGEVCEWKLRGHQPLPTWIQGSVALLGDACHPTLPHLAQGAVQAIEDGAVLGVCLSRIKDTSPETIYGALKCYEETRKQRAETLVEMAASSGRELHLGEGAAKDERDLQFAKLKAARGKGRVPDKWADQDVQKLIYGTDCIAMAEKALALQNHVVAVV